MTKSKISRKEKERQRHRQEIMAAAERVFAENGYYESSIQDIAAAAEFSVGTIYNFFENKEGLFSSILKEGLAEMRGEIERRLKTIECPLERIRATIACQMNIAEKHKHLMKLLFDFKKPRIIGRQDLIDDEIVSFHMVDLNELAKLFAEAIEQGKIVPFNPLYLAIGIDGLIFRFWEHYKILDELNSYEDITQIIEDIFIKRILTENHGKS